MAVQKVKNKHPEFFDNYNQKQSILNTDASLNEAIDQINVLSAILHADNMVFENKDDNVEKGSLVYPSGRVLKLAQANSNATIAKGVYGGKIGNGHLMIPYGVQEIFITSSLSSGNKYDYNVGTQLFLSPYIAGTVVPSALSEEATPSGADEETQYTQYIGFIVSRDFDEDLRIAAHINPAQTPLMGTQDTGQW